MKPHYVWYGHASSEGGPLLVADLDDYPAWRGADETWADDALYRVHYYGPIIDKLPARFQPSGAAQWHQFALIAGSDAARAYVRDLRAAAEAIHPGLVMREQKRMAFAELVDQARVAMTAPAGEAMENWLTSWRDHIEGGADFYANDERLLHVDAKPDTDYARACEALTGDAALVSYGAGATGVAWSLAGPGTARVAIRKDGFVLMRSWLDDEPKHERAARDRATSATDDVAAGEIAFASGRIAIVWAPVAPRDLVADGDPASALRAAAELRPPVQLNQAGILGVGTLVRMPPGRYRFACGAHADDGWRCRWIRFALD